MPEHDIVLSVSETKEFVDIICRQALLIPLDAARNLAYEFDRMGALMPLFDPTLYQKVGRNIPDHRRAANAFYELRKVLEEIKNG